MKTIRYEKFMNDFPRIRRLPPYIFSTIDQLKQEVRAKGHDIFDFGMGNPDQPTPPHIVEALREAVLDPSTHRYTAPRGILELRLAITQWYGKRFNVDLDPETESIVTLGSKEGLAHLAIATLGKNDTVLVPSPCYPVHQFGSVLADANVRQIPLTEEKNFLTTLENTIQEMWPKPKMLFLNFPANPTAQCVDLAFFERVVEICREHQIWIVHDLAYADLVFDGYRAPSILEVPGAKDIAVEAYTLSKSYNMAGWRVGFMSGNAKLIQALTRIKSYIDYGSFAAVQKAAVAALEGPDDCIRDLCHLYKKRRDILCAGLQNAGWDAKPPKATMFVWVKIPEPFSKYNSLEFAKMLLREAHVAVSPGVGFGEYGNQHVRFSLIEDEPRMIQALQNIRQFMRLDEKEDFTLELVTQ
jgi:alanine-synthesizing transaminase